LANLHSTADINQLYPYIRAAVRRYVFKLRDVVPPELWRDEIDELTQVACFKYWQASQRDQITYPQAYVSKIVHSLVVDMARRYKATVRLLLDEYGEVVQGNVLVCLSEGMSDPAYEFERKEVMNDYIRRVVSDIISLPPCQRRAMICLLKDEVHYSQQFVEEFKKHGIVIELVSSPKEQRAVQASRASLSVARKKMRSLKNRNARAG
jgi:DNA-directed RNA polymerase specialized sigma24 family protein